ncbi:MAG: PD-(D/E)XK nuclease family protein [Acidaminococcaceae bacterium]
MDKMADLFCVNLGETMRGTFAEKIRQYAYGEALLVLPNRFLLQSEQQKGRVRAVNMDYLPNEILRVNKRDRFVMLSRRSQEIIVKKIIDSKKKAGELKYLLNIADTDSFTKIVTGFIGELSRSGTTSEEFADVVSAWERNGGYGLKDKEIASIYSNYRDQLKKNNWYDIDGLYRLATIELKKSKSIVPWQALFFSDFYQFDHLQLDFINTIKERCNVKIGIVSDLKNDELYGATLNTASDLIGRGFKLHKEDCLTDRKEDLKHFCLHWKNTTAVFDKAVENIMVFELSSIENEMRTVLEDIKQRILDGTSCADILLVVRNIDSYNGLRNLFDEYGIPTTLPKVTSFLAQPTVELVNNFLNLAKNGYDVNKLYELLCCNLTKLLYDFDGEKVAELRTKRYFSNSEQLKNYLKNNYTLEENSAITKLLDCAATLPEYAKTGEYCLLLHDLIKNWHLAERFGEYYKQGHISLEELKNIILTEKICYEVLDEIEKVYKESKESEKRIQIDDFINIWLEIVSEKEVVLEKGNCQGVCVLEAANVQGIYFKHIYIMGLRESEFPSLKQENWLYNDSERSALKMLGVDLKSSASGLIEDQFFFASTVAAATQSLTLSYFVDAEAGASGYLNEMKQYFADDSLKALEKKSNHSDCWSEEQFIESLCSLQMLTKKEEEWLAAHVGNDYEFRRNLDRKRFIKNSQYQGCLGNNLTAKIRINMGEYYSPSALEVYAFCPFKFLVSKVWKTDIWQEASDETEAVDQGDLYHVVLAKFFARYIGKNISCLDNKMLESDLQVIFNSVCEEFLLLGKLKKTDFLDTELQQIWTKLRRVLAVEIDYQKKLSTTRTNLLPAFIELGFGNNKGEHFFWREIDGEKAFFTGRIDRIDADDETFFITDYKRTNGPAKKDFEAGLDMQMPLYVLASKELFADNKRTLLGGGYFSIENAQRKNGYWRKEAEFLPWLKRGDDNWQTFLEKAEQSLTSCVRGIRAADYQTEPKKQCPSYCPGIDICRYSLVDDLQEEGSETDD